jgi:hypothetical protein
MASMPSGHRDLGSDQGGFAAIAFLDDFEQMEALLVGEGVGSEVVEDDGDVMGTDKDDPESLQHSRSFELVLLIRPTDRRKPSGPAVNVSQQQAGDMTASAIVPLPKTTLDQRAPLDGPDLSSWRSHGEPGP